MFPAPDDSFPRIFAPVLAPGSCEWLLQRTDAAFRTVLVTRDHHHVLAALPQRPEVQLRGCGG